MGRCASRLSEWSSWSVCSRKCELGTTERSRQIIKEGSGGLGAGLALKEVGLKLDEWRSGLVSLPKGFHGVRQVKGCMTDCGEVDCRWET